MELGEVSENKWTFKKIKGQICTHIKPVELGNKVTAKKKAATKD